MRIFDDGENHYGIDFTDAELEKVRALARKELMGVHRFIEKALRSGIELYRYIITGKE